VGSQSRGPILTSTRGRPVDRCPWSGRRPRSSGPRQRPAAASAARAARADRRGVQASPVGGV